MKLSANYVLNKTHAPVRGGGERGASPTTPISGLVLNHTQQETAYKQALINNLKLQNGTNVNSIYTQRLTIYGNSLLLITYNTPQYTHTNPTRQDYSQSPSSRRSDSLWRTRNYIAMLCTANVDANPLYRPVFLTLTFKKNIKDIKEANYHYTLFIQRLKYQIRSNLKYIAVIEFQKRGSIHYHCVFFNLPFIQKDKLESIWSHGFSNIQIAKNINDVSKYVSKYMSKQLLDKRLVGQKAYFCSRGLQRPKTYYLQNSIDNVLKNVKLNLTEVITKPSYQIKKFRI